MGAHPEYRKICNISEEYWVLGLGVCIGIGLYHRMVGLFWSYSHCHIRTCTSTTLP